MGSLMALRIEMLTYIFSIRSLRADSLSRFLNLRRAIAQQSGNMISYINIGALKPVELNISLKEIAVSR